MSSKQEVEGVCCMFCKHEYTPACPVLKTKNWSRWKSFCYAYEVNKHFTRAKELVVGTKPFVIGEETSCLV